MSRFYRSVWISDLHLASRESQAEMVHSFLDQIKCDYLYLVGDIIDVWSLRKSWHWPKQYNEVMHKLLKRSRKGAKVIYIPGNHDEFFRGFEGITFGDIEIKRRDVHTTADGKRLLVTHGDEFDTIIRHKTLSLLACGAHQHLIRLNNAVNFIRKLFGLREWSLSKAVARKVQQTFHPLKDFEKLVVEDARRMEMDGVVCGHSHRPAMEMRDGVLYCNAGDWTNNCTALVEHMDGKMELLSWRDILAADRAEKEPPAEPLRVRRYIAPRPAKPAASPIPATAD